MDRQAPKYQRNQREQQQGKPKEEFESKLLDLARVTKVTGGGKTMRFRAVIVVGDKRNRVGVGVAKGRDVSQAVEKATRAAKKNILEIPSIGETIPHETEAKFGPARVLLRPQGKGRGLVAGGVVRVICHLAGIKDISSKLMSRSRNKLNIAQATISALKKLKNRNVVTDISKKEIKD
ncbi:MAG: 30S ribosomal protein S5 [Candidatus Gribaldobacteria bacterium]|nr:30S ribosomal protein S5 [Candidatus Gribaldobacteria bacterium]